MQIATEWEKNRNAHTQFECLSFQTAHSRSHSLVVHFECISNWLDARWKSKWYTEHSSIVSPPEVEFKNVRGSRQSSAQCHFLSFTICRACWRVGGSGTWFSTSFDSIVTISPMDKLRFVRVQLSTVLLEYVWVERLFPDGSRFLCVCVCVRTKSGQRTKIKTLCIQIERMKSVERILYNKNCVNRYKFETQFWTPFNADGSHRCSFWMRSLFHIYISWYF